MTSSSSELDIKLHPLVIISISDHHTRIRAQVPSGGSMPRVVGCLQGVQSGRVVEIFNSFELKYDVDENGVIIIDDSFLRQKQAQYKKVFPTYEILGWYSTGVEPTEDDMVVHKMMLDYNESPVYMLLNPIISHLSKDLPISIFESELHVIDGNPALIFVKSSYSIETVEAERISVDHVARMTKSDPASGVTTLSSHLGSMRSAIEMLHSRLALLLEYFRQIESGTLPYNHTILRQVSSLVHRLPSMDTDRFHRDYLTEYNDALLMTYLSTITRGISQIGELADKFNVAYEKGIRRRGPFV